MITNIKEFISDAAKIFFQDYGTISISLLVGVIFGWYFKYIFTDKKYNKLINKTLGDKEKEIEFLKDIVHKRLQNIIVEKKDKFFFNKVKKFFKAKVN
jgi:hypothetical protein